MEALRVEGLSKRFGGLNVLKGISFTVEVGRRVAIIGPNGAGKTTLLRLLCGELALMQGRVFAFGKDITGAPVHQRTHLGIGRSYQTCTLFQTLTVVDNALLACHGTRPSRFQMFRPHAAYPDLIDKVRRSLPAGLWDKKDELLQNLSHGEQRQMELACCLVSEPKLLLLDEPSAGLIPAEATRLVHTLNALSRETTVLLVEHDMDVVFGFADEIMVLYYGEILARGTPQEIRANAKVREIYLGSGNGELQDGGMSAKAS